MAGPKAPIGTLSQHASQAARLAKTVGSNPGKTRAAAAAAAGKRKVMEDDSDSDESDSDSDNETPVDNDTYLRELQSKSSGSKSKPEIKAKVEPKSPEQLKTVAKKEAASSETKKVVAKKESSPEESSSEESSSESGSDSGSDSEDKKKPTKSNGAAKVKSTPAADDKKITKKVPASKKAAQAEESESEEDSSSEAESSSSEESESEDEKEPSKKVTTKPAPKTTAQPAKVPAKSKEAASSSSEASSSEEEEESSSDDGAEEADESMAIDQRNGNGELSRIPEIVSKEFHLRKAEDGANAAEVAKFFNEAKKEGKQIWYFTAPASIPIEVVEKLEIPLDRAQKGQSILSHNGDDYGVAFEDASTARTIKLVIPNRTGDQYRMMNGSVDQIMHLKRVTQFSEGGESLLSLTQTTHTPSTARPARQQPPNLKARFQPFGVNGSNGEMAPPPSSRNEDVDMEDASPPSSQKTPAKEAEKKNKRKHEAETPKAESTKKSKKAKIEKEPPSSAIKPIKQTPIAPPSIPSRGISATPASTKASKAKAAPSATPKLSTETSSGSMTGRKETPVPLPSFRQASTSESLKSPEPVEEKKPKAKASKKASTVPNKTTPIPLPNIAGAS